ncbi:MAG: trigger factor [Acidobacteriota bacterium]
MSDHDPELDPDHSDAPEAAAENQFDPAAYDGVEGVVVREHSASSREIVAVLPRNRLDEFVDGEARKLARKIQLPGFRKGKAPVARVKSLHRPELEERGLEAIVQDSFREVVERDELQPVGPMVLQDVQLEDEATVRFAGRFDVLPRIELTGLDEIKVESKVVKVTDAEIEEELERLQSDRAELIDSDDDEVSPASWVEIRLERFAPAAKSGEGDEPLSDWEGTVEVGAEQNLPGLDSALLGMGPGEMRWFDSETKAPAEEGEEPLAFRYRVMVKGLKDRKLPPLDDEFARTLAERFESLDQLRQEVRDHAVKQKRSQAEAELDRELIEQLLQRNPCEMPGSLVEKEAEARLRRAVQGMRMQGMDPAQARVDWQAEFERARQVSAGALAADYLLDLVARDRNIEVTDDMLKDELERIADEAGQTSRQVRAELEKSKRMSGLKDSLLRRRTLEELRAGAEVTVE